MRMHFQSILLFINEYIKLKEWINVKMCVYVCVDEHH